MKNDESCSTITILACSRRLGVSRNFAYQMAREGRIPTIRLGKRLLVPKARLDAMLAGQDGQPKG